MKNYVFNFGGGKADGDGKMKDVLGGKGAGLAEMSKAGVPVPPGFTISTEVCNIYFQNGNSVPTEINDQVLKALTKLEKQIGKKLGDPKNPLLVSVRSGAKFSMPGMMNTILNLGLNDATTEGLALLTSNPNFDVVLVGHIDSSEKPSGRSPRGRNLDRNRVLQTAAVLSGGGGVARNFTGMGDERSRIGEIGRSDQVLRRLLSL